MARAVIVLDTHALLWWALDPDRLSEVAAATCRRMERDGAFASSISLWEIGVKVRNGKLELGLSLEEFVRRLEATAVIDFVPVDAPIWGRTVALDWNHRDPADRVIVATALGLGLPILTKDAALHAFGGIQCIWD